MPSAAFPTLLRTTGAGFCYNIGRIFAALGTVTFGLFAKVGTGAEAICDHRLALFYARFLFLPAALVTWLWLPEQPAADGAISPLAEPESPPLLASPRSNENTDARLLRLHPADNVLTVISTLEPGDRLRMERDRARSRSVCRSGTRSPRAPSRPDEKIMKYGAPIGSATGDIAAG